MNKRGMYVIGLTALLMGVMLTTYTVWTQSDFSHGEPEFDQGCYCHNNGIAIFVNGTGDGNGGISIGPLQAGGSFHLYISTNNVAATGVVPGLQQWESNETDNAKFNVSPTQVTDGSAQDRSTTVGNITALYKMTAPATPGIYVLTLYAQGTLMQPIIVQVSGSTTTTSSTTSSTSTTTTSSSTHSSSTSTTSTTSATSSTTSSTTSKSTSASSTSTTSTTATTKSTTTSSTTATTSQPPFEITVATNAQTYSATEALIITGSVSPAPGPGTAVEIQITNPDYTTVVFDDNVTVAASGGFTYTVNIVANSTGWVSGTYTLTVTSQEPAPMMITSQFLYTPHTVTVTTTSTSVTVTSTTTYTHVSLQTSTQTTTATVTQPPLTTTATQTTTQTTTQTSIQTTTAPPTTQTQTLTNTSTVTNTSSVIPDWAYGAMVVLLLVGLAIGYLVTRPSARQS
jgi:hypothetical protein